MNEFIKAVRVLIIALCVALFAVGIIWNLVYGTMSEQGGYGNFRTTCSQRCRLGAAVYC